MLVILLIPAGILLPSIQGGPSTGAPRAQCVHNLRGITQALRMYHEMYGAFPPAYTVDAQGKRLHSWRTLILPFADGQARYVRIDLSKPWDDPANAAAFKEAAPPIYRCPNFRGTKTHTSYLTVVSTRSCLRGGKSVSLADITDPPGLTMLVFDAPQDREVHWMSPEDADEKLLLSISAKSKLLHNQGFNAAMADSSVKFVWSEASDETLKALTTVDGNDRVDGAFLN